MGTEGNKKEIRSFDSVTFDGQDLGNCLLVTCTFEKELYDILSGKTNRRVDMKEWIKDILVELELNDFSNDPLTKLWGITATNMSAGSTAVSAEAYTFGAVKVWGALAHGQSNESPIGSVVVYNSTTTFTENTDYGVDYTNGLGLNALTGGDCATKEVSVNYNYSTQASKRWKIGTAKVDTTGALILTKTLEDSTTLTIKLYNSYVASDLPFPWAPGELSKWTVQFRAIETANSGEELGYVDRTTS